MDRHTQNCIEHLKSDDKDLRYQALLDILKLTEEKVDWAYDIWDSLVEDLTHSDNHQRAIAAQLLCNLAKSDPEGKIFEDFAALIELTKDKRFVTARHGLQSLWKIGLAGERQKELLLNGLTERYRTCMEEKNGTLIRFDIIQGLRNLYDSDHDETVKQKALDLIDREEDVKYRKKYASLWKK
ncbi:MAG: hypothetical protein K0R28_1543 [Paenibacillus sp.]|jgi:hypothetical protein|nr:hypothetical protein [Paenibacillus sp.]